LIVDSLLIAGWAIVDWQWQPGIGQPSATINNRQSAITNQSKINNRPSQMF
jgi:hypothetical protein